MNNKGNMTIKELMGIFIFVLVLVLVFSPLVSKVYGIFKSTSDEDKAKANLDEINYQIDSLVKSGDSESKKVLMDEPFNWFLVGNEKNELCICWTLAKPKTELQGDICDEYGGKCAKTKIPFHIDNPITDNKRNDAIVGAQNAIKLDSKFLVIENNNGMYVTFRKSVTESNLNNVLNEFLYGDFTYYEDGKVIANTKKTNKDVVKELCNSNLTNRENFEYSLKNFFGNKVDSEDKVRIQIGKCFSTSVDKGDENHGLSNVFLDLEFVYPGGKFYDTYMPSIPKFSGTLPATYEIINYKENKYCAVYLTSTTDELK